LKGRGVSYFVKLFGLALLAFFVAVGAERGSLPDAEIWQIVASRSLGHLLTSPTAFVPGLFTAATAVFTLGLAGWLVATRKKPVTTAGVFCCCLLSAGATDVPLLALLLTLAAVIAKVPAVTPETAPPSAAGVAAPQSGRERTPEASSESGI
jgi:hypothetical protein